MIDLYYWTTPNGHKIPMLLEELALPYHVFPINIGKGEQFASTFVAISPNNRIPAIVDHDPPDRGTPIPIFESGAILLYLADKCGQFVPTDFRGRLTCLQWLFWQVGGLGPMNGQNHHFALHAPEKIPYAIDRYIRESGRLYAVLNKRLSHREFILDSYSIADIAAYPWVNPERQSQNIDEFPHIKRWRANIAARPATVRAYALAKSINPSFGVPLDAAANKVLFGQDKKSVR